MELLHKALSRFSVRDLMLIAAFSAMGIAAKVVAVPLVRIVSVPLLIPGGALGGGLYMLWLVIAAGFTKKRGAAALTGFVQAVLVIITGLGGSHGLFSLVSYTVPGLAVETVFFLFHRRSGGLWCAFISCAAANICGTLLVGPVFLRLPAAALLISLPAAAFSGGLGGILAFHLLCALRKFNIMPE